MLGISVLHCDSLTHEVLGFLDLLAYIWMMQSWVHHLLSLGMSSPWEVGLTLQNQQGSGRRSISNHQLVQTERERDWHWREDHRGNTLGILRRSRFGLIGLVLFRFLKERIKEREKNQNSLSVKREHVAGSTQMSPVRYMTVEFEAGGGSKSCMDKKCKESLKVQARPKLTPRYQTGAFGLDFQASGSYILNACRMPVCGYVSKN